MALLILSVLQSFRASVEIISAQIKKCAKRIISTLSPRSDPFSKNAKFEREERGVPMAGDIHPL
ncbi:MAG: hypothetical protein HYX78_08790 [Armatimonadetes bacterium]|nr:hypothetical protein [Armatimonadota bacterium]